MEAALTERLTPKASNDILADAKLKSRSRADAKPYVIVFVGVNGVGPSSGLHALVTS
jgi:signal recognition particle GTPase